MDDSRGEIEGIMDRTGLTEPEARARYHLREAYKALNEVAGTPVAPDVEPMGPHYSFTVVYPHFDALHGFLAMRVLERERPDGWKRGGR